MTKIPIFLSTLALFGGTGITSVEPSLASTSSIVANQGAAGVKFTELRLASSQLKWEFQYDDDEGRVFSRYILTSLDYASGVTEAEADQKLSTLGESDDEDWTHWRVDYSARDASYVKGKALSATIAWGDAMESSPTDLIYYAFQYKNWNNPSIEPVWYRGKLDYRKCAHDPEIESRYGQTCSFSLDEETNQYTISPSGGTLSYEEEMAQLARRWYLDTVVQQVERLEQRKREGDETYRSEVPGAESSLEQAKRMIAAMNATDQLADEIEDLEQRIAELKREDQPSTGENEESKDPEDPKDPEEPEEPSDPEGAGGSGDAGDLGGQSSIDDAGKSGSIANLSGSNSADNSNNTAARFWPASNTNTAYNQTSEDSQDTATIDNEIDDRSGISDTGDAEIELPNLGASEPWLKQHLWVLLLPFGVVILLALILAKRRRDED